MPLRNPEQFGVIIRQRRKTKGISQAALAELLGVERKWVIRLEAGNPRAEFGLALKALAALGIEASVRAPDAAAPEAGRGRAPASRLDEVFQRLQRPLGK